MPPGMEIINSWNPEEIRAYLTENFITIPCTIEMGQNLKVGQILGERPTTEQYVAYDKDAESSATSPVKTGTGNGTMSEVGVQDKSTLTETWTITCTEEVENGGNFSVVGSVSGNVGNASVGSEFKYPNTDDYMIKFTITDGAVDFAVGDKFTFNTTAAGGRTAKGILTENVDASSGAEVSAMYVEGNFVESKLTGLDAQAKESLNGRSIAGTFFIP